MYGDGVKTGIRVTCLLAGAASLSGMLAVGPATSAYAGAAVAGSRVSARLAQVSMGPVTAWRPKTGTRTNPGRWDGCTPIVWKADFTTLRRMGGNVTAERRRLKSAFVAVSAASGYTFVFRGEGSYPRAGDQWGRLKDEPGVDLVVSYQSHRAPAGYRNPAFRGKYGTAGFGGTSWRSAPAADGGRADRFADGEVTINAWFVLGQRRDPDPAAGDLIRSLYLHEIGHAMGLAHVSNQWQMMHDGLLNHVPDRYGAGDRAGLAYLKSRPCFVPEPDFPVATDPIELAAAR